MDHKQHNRPYVEIVEQPARKSLRFRYMCEGRSAGSIPGVNSTSKCKTFPSIRIVGYKGRAVIVVSCVTKDKPYRPHPHNIVGKDTCNRGVCTMEVCTQNSPISFTNLGIQCVKKKEIAAALKLREEIRVDPYRNGFQHENQYMGIDLNAVRLCFQVFLEGPEEGKFGISLDPVVSDPIYDKKTIPELMICKLSHCSAPTCGAMEMIILCEKVMKDDIEVVFFETHHGEIVWKAYGEFHPADVHKQTAISLKTPVYRAHQINQPIQVWIQLRRPSDGETSDALPFTMIPSDAGDAIYAKRKRQKFNISGAITQQNYPECIYGDISRVFVNNAPVEAGAPNIPKENSRMTLLQQLQAEAENNEKRRNQLDRNTCDFIKSRMPYSGVNNGNAITTNATPLPQRNHQFTGLSHSMFDTAVSQMTHNCYNGVSSTSGQSNVPMAAYHYSLMPQSICNEPPLLYNVTSRKSELQHHELHNQSNNYVGCDPTDTNFNEYNIDVGQADSNLDLLFPSDIEGFVNTTLSDTFCSGFSITDTTETQLMKDETLPAGTNYCRT